MRRSSHQYYDNIGEGWRPRKGQLDIYGNEIPDRIYTNSDYDYNIIIEDRIPRSGPGDHPIP